MKVLLIFPGMILLLWQATSVFYGQQREKYEDQTSMQGRQRRVDSALSRSEYVKRQLLAQNCGFEDVGQHEARGAGIREVNQAYEEGELVNGRPSYTSISMSFEREFSLWWNGEQWIIDENATQHYYNDTDSPTPPQTGWVAINKANAAPTIHLIGSYSVKGAGDMDANGAYVEDGVHNGKTLYRHDGWLLRYANCGEWQLVSRTIDDSTDILHYRVSSLADTPPASGWMAADGTRGAAPTLMACTP